MKTILSIAAVVGLAASASADFVVGDFEDNTLPDWTSSANWNADFGGAAGNSAWDANGAGGSAGSLKFTMNFSTINADNSIAYTNGNRVYPGEDVTAYNTFEFDYYIDGNSVQDAFGNYGYAKFASRNTDNFDWIGTWEGNLAGPTDQWNHISIDITGHSINELRAMTFQLYGGPGQNLDGFVYLSIDNVAFTPAPASLGVLGLGLIGVRRRK